MTQDPEPGHDTLAVHSYEIDSVVAAGTTIRLSFPIATAPAVGSEAVTATIAVAPLRILTVDDAPMVLRSLRETLEADGHTVATADGGEAGIDAFVAASTRQSVPGRDYGSLHALCRWAQSVQCGENRSSRHGRADVDRLGPAAYLLRGFASLPASNAILRKLEHQADLYGLNASQAPLGLAEFMIHDADTVRLRLTFIEYASFYTHPSDAERVATAMQWRAASAQLSALSKPRIDHGLSPSPASVCTEFASKARMSPG